MMQFIKATPKDLPAIMEIIDDAKALLKANGIDQWQKGYPNEQVLGDDIANDDLYLVQEEDGIVAVLALIFGEDPNYKVIEKGSWLTDFPYSAIHRVAVKKDKLGRGVMGRIFEVSEQMTREKGLKSLRIDTHPDNQSMQRALTKAGYQYCGHVFMGNGDLRFAYEKPLT
ncbi:GNAT family N-acetyltransferase [Jeotgalibaca sp. A127]|uniref:GNAT family N-acetyltransferase n=1 Tax=Jeotgalibaca sp. A127 TaxID=3457324 RepID=UPI003FCF5B53